MALTPAKHDPNRRDELKRRKAEPIAFGFGKTRTQQAAKKQATN